MSGGGADFPAWLRLTHLFNILFITLMMRSGVQILFSLPKLYWSDDALPGSEWPTAAGARITPTTTTPSASDHMGDR